MLVSVVVASYNYEKYIRETLDSILAQTNQNFELIVVDDGSKDTSVEIIKEYVKKDKRVALYQHEGGVNKGLVETIKLAVSKAKGEYIAFLESDDWWEKDCLEKKLKYALSFPEAAIITNDLDMFGEDAKSVEKRERLQGLFEIVLNKPEPADVFFEMYYHNVLSTFSAVMVKADILRACDFNSVIPAWLDWWLWRQIAFEHKIGGINEKLTHWRVHPQSYNTASDKGKKSSKLFIKAGNKLLKQRFGVRFGKRIWRLMPRFLWRAFKRKSLRIYRKGDYVRVSLFGMGLFKIRVL